MACILVSIGISAHRPKRGKTTGHLLQRAQYATRRQGSCIVSCHHWLPFGRNTHSTNPPEWIARNRKPASLADLSCNPSHIGPIWTGRRSFLFFVGKICEVVKDRDGFIWVLYLMLRGQTNLNNNMSIKSQRTFSVFAWLFFTTGVFAIIGSLFSWGEGWLFSNFNISNGLIPLADLILSGPISMIAAYGLWVKRAWGIYLGLFTSGIYGFGSVLVFISVIWNGSPYPIQLVVPPLAGLSIAISFFCWVIIQDPIKKQDAYREGGQ